MIKNLYSYKANFYFILIIMITTSIMPASISLAQDYSYIRMEFSFRNGNLYTEVYSNDNVLLCSGYVSSYYNTIDYNLAVTPLYEILYSLNCDPYTIYSNILSGSKLNVTLSDNIKGTHDLYTPLSRYAVNYTSDYVIIDFTKADSFYVSNMIFSYEAIIIYNIVNHNTVNLDNNITIIYSTNVPDNIFNAVLDAAYLIDEISNMLGESPLRTRVIVLSGPGINENYPQGTAHSLSGTTVYLKVWQVSVPYFNEAWYFKNTIHEFSHGWFNFPYVSGFDVTEGMPEFISWYLTKMYRPEYWDTYERMSSIYNRLIEGSSYYVAGERNLILYYIVANYSTIVLNTSVSYFDIYKQYFTKASFNNKLLFHTLLTVHIPKYLAEVSGEDINTIVKELEYLYYKVLYTPTYTSEWPYFNVSELYSILEEIINTRYPVPELEVIIPEQRLTFYVNSTAKIYYYVLSNNTVIIPDNITIRTIPGYDIVTGVLDGNIGYISLRSSVPNDIIIIVEVNYNGTTALNSVVVSFIDYANTSCIDNTISNNVTILIDKINNISSVLDNIANNITALNISITSIVAQVNMSISKSINSSSNEIINRIGMLDSNLEDIITNIDKIDTKLSNLTLTSEKNTVLLEEYYNRIYNKVSSISELLSNIYYLLIVLLIIVLFRASIAIPR